MHRRILSSLLRLVGCSVLALGASALVPAPAYADPPGGWPADNWPVCADADAQYCLEEATVTPVGGSATPLAGLGLSMYLTTLGGYVTSFNWAVNGFDGASADVRNGDVRLVIRVGQFAPRYTMAIAKNLRITRSTDGGGNTTMVITGRAVHMDWKTTDSDFYSSCISGSGCGGEDTMADPWATGYAFSGNTQDLETWGEGAKVTLDGMYIATNAEARPTTILYGTYPEPYWMMPFLGNPHLGVDGNPVRGSFNAWLPPSYFTAMGTDATSAAAVGFDVQSREGATTVSLPAGVALQDGGVGIDVPDLGFSVHEIKVVGQASQAAGGGTAPGRPRTVTTTPAPGGVIAQWSAPLSNGGLPIARYTARAFTAPTGGTIAGRCTVTGNNRCRIDGLNYGQTYYISVSATNALGEGPGTAVRVSGTPNNLPSAPRPVLVTPGDTKLNVTWGLPATAGGSAINGYTARAYTDAGAVAGSCNPSSLSTRTCSINGLFNGKTYYVDVTASNSAGAGLPSSPRVAGTPRTVPSAPRQVALTPGNRTLAVTWVAPSSTGGSAVTGYSVRAYSVVNGVTIAQSCAPANLSSLTCTLGTLTNGATYYVTVVAINAAGKGPETTPRVAGSPHA
jgi:hypothetical protein